MLPTVIIHVGVSLDGRYDWSLDVESPYYEIVQMLESDADLSGSNTMLNANLPEDPEVAFGDLYSEYINSPDRSTLVVADSQGQVLNWDLIKRQPWWRNYICLCSNKTPGHHLKYLKTQGVDYILAGEDRIEFKPALQELYSRYQLNVIRVDSGGILNGILLRAGLVDEVSVVVAPELVGGISPYSMYTAPDLFSVEGVIPLRLVHLEHMQNDHVWLRYEVIKDE